jgi:hypothetical protein
MESSVDARLAAGEPYAEWWTAFTYSVSARSVHKGIVANACICLVLVGSLCIGQASIANDIGSSGLSGVVAGDAAGSVI